MIIDFKITPNEQRQRSYVTQLQLYGYLLEKEGIKCPNLLLCAVLVPPRPMAADKLDVLRGLTERDTMALYSRVVALRAAQPRNKNLSAFRVPLRRGLIATLRAFPYDRAFASNGELRFFSQFWRGTRPARASAKVEKCRCCLYNREELCDEAVGPFSP